MSVTNREAGEAIRQTVNTGLRLPFGCTLWLFDFIGVVYVITHWSTVSVQIARLIGMIP